MKKIYLFAAMAAMLASCSSDDVTTEMQTAKQSAENVPVSFNAYVPRATTRAGQTGTIDTDGLQTPGFGVFGYYTNADNYDQTFTPNFMYNQHVTYSSGWEYTPVKYWPNEFGSGALSDDVDKVSFFAYAPYVAVNAPTGKVTDPDLNTWGIVGMKNNNATGDPMVKYISTFYTDKQVDLLWGTVGVSSWQLKNGGDNQTWTTGTPWLDVQHPKGTGQQVKFDFKHSLASLNVTVDTYANKQTPPAGTTAADPATNTKVFIRSVTFEGFDIKGALNLNNNKELGAGKALWYNFDCLNELNNGAEVTIQDGRKDGKEGLSAATKENVGINPLFIQDKVFGSTNAGVTGTPYNLFCKSNTSILLNTSGETTLPIFVIPNGDPLKVTIEYDVLTKDDNLAGTLNDGQTKGSVIKNVITRYINANGNGNPSTKGDITLENGKQYTISLHLGLNSVEFDASVTAWDAAVTGGADLPHNN